MLLTPHCLHLIQLCVCGFSTKDSVTFVVEFNIFTFCSETGLPWAGGGAEYLGSSETLTQASAASGRG